ncbi:MAG: hypothetical protein LBQ12_15275 [Deltaproteobacteria bacterium]|jgi:hypothetical protein|nr:hypothetical protein [Deltaproteobacteria bacterium]
MNLILANQAYQIVGFGMDWHGRHYDALENVGKHGYKENALCELIVGLWLWLGLKAQKEYTLLNRMEYPGLAFATPASGPLGGSWTR